MADRLQGTYPCVEEYPQGLCCQAQVYFTGSDPLTAAPGHSHTPPLMVVLIEQPPLVRWSMGSHKAFPTAFKESAAALLSCHTRLSSNNTRSATPSDVHPMLLRAMRSARMFGSCHGSVLTAVVSMQAQQGCMQPGRPPSTPGMACESLH